MSGGREKEGGKRDDKNSNGGGEMNKFEELTDAQVEALFGELGHGLTVDSVVMLSDTFADLIATARMYYNEYGRIGLGKTGEYPALEIRQCQIRKGDTRRDLVAIDIGSRRLVTFI